MGLLSFFKGLFGGASGSSSDFIGGWYAKALREPITGGLPIKPKLLVIHFTAGASAESSISYWRKLSNGICAHFVIDRNGAIFQCRPCDVACGHAGRSSWELKGSGLKLSGLNAHSIGIELANGGSTFPGRFSNLMPVLAKHKNGGPAKEWEQYPAEQLEACARLSRALVDRYDLAEIVGHDDISPGRKVDPGPAFPMQWLRGECGM